MPPGVSESSVASTIDQVLAPAFLGRLGRMRLAVRHIYGARPGDTPVRGHVQASGLELERHKVYDPGDELRHLDWNAYARLDQLLVRQFRAEREAPVHIFLDGSASMGVPAEDGKFPFAAGLALALACVAVRHHNPVRLVCLQQREGGVRVLRLGPGPITAEDYAASPVVRFPAFFQRLASFAASLSPSGDTLLERGVEDYVQAHAVPGLAILISDFLVAPEVIRRVLHELSGRKHEVAVLRPLGAGERDPSRLFQSARVRDAESGEEKLVRLSPENLGRYQSALGEHLRGLEDACADNESLFATCDVEAGLAQCVFTQLPRIGLLR